MNNLITRPSSIRSNILTRFFNDPTDILFRDFFDSNSVFNSLFDIEKINYPVDIKENENGLELDVAVVGIDKKDIIIQIKDENILSISYDKKSANESKMTEKDQYIYKGITNKAFNMAWKINSKFDLTKLEAKIDKGMLKISIPISPEKESKFIEIKD